MPDWAREVRTRLSSLRLSSEREAEIVEELAQHLDERCRELIADGASPEEAAQLTLAELRDGPGLARDMAPLRQAHVPRPITPGAPGGRVLVDLWQDLRYARRTLAARPGFTAVAVLSLALGIGADTAIFGLWNGLLHASLPGVHHPDELVMLSNPDEAGSWTGRTNGPRSWLTYEEFEQLRDHTESFSGVMASQSSLNSWQVRFERGTWEEASGRLVSGGYFAVLGVRPAIGRLFTAADDRTDAPYAAVLSDTCWRRRFGGRTDVLGKTVIIRKAALTIIGVAPPGFIGETSGQQPDLWLPLRMQPALLPGRDRLHDTPPDKAMWLHVFGRLKPHVTPAQAEAEANAIFRAGLEAFYGAAASGPRGRELLDQRLQVRSGRRGASPSRSELAQSLTALLAAVGVLLLIACANLANLLLARGAARKPEMAVRLSLGASRARLVRQLVTESLVLAVMGGAAAIGVASMFHGVLVQMMAKSHPSFQMSFVVSPLVLAFVVAATGAAVLVFGVLPALQVTKTDPGACLRDQARGTIGARGQLRSSRWLVSLQLALSLPLLVGAGLLARTVYNLQRADLGFPAERLLLVRVDFEEAGYESPRRDAVLRELLGQIRQIPGVRAASFSQLGLFSGGESSSTIVVEGHTATGVDDRESALDIVGPSYFSTLGIPIVAGREILEQDSRGGPDVCVINEAFVRRFFARRNPIGMHITLVYDEARPSCEVVGVARNAYTQGLRGDVEPRFFVPNEEPLSSASSPTFLIRTATAAAPVMAVVQRTIQRIDAGLPIVSAASIEEQMAPLTAQDRAVAQLAIAFGCVALALAAIGLYGVLSYGISRRTGEIAVRIALGAQSGRVISMILRETIGVVGVGLALGGALAYTASRWIDSRLYGVAPQDPVTVALSTGLLVVVAFGATYLPAQGASRVDPATALRQS